MRSNYKKIGKFVRQVSTKNTDLSITDLKGISINKEFMPSVANVNGTDLSKYRVVEKEQFAFNPMHVGRDEVLPISMLETDEKVIVSPAYVVFEIIDKNELDPEYLMMWCRRPEFDRNAWFTTDNSVRGGFSWADFCEMKLPIPSIEKQREIVKEYNVIVNRIKLNEQINQKLEETAQAVYKQWFVDFEFPNKEGKPYKSSGGEMVYNEELELEIPKGWKAGYWKDIATQFSGFPFKGEQYSLENGISVVRGENVTERKLRWDTLKKWNKPLNDRTKEYFLNENDIVIGMDGSKVGKNFSLISKFQLPLLLAQRVACVRAKNPNWQFYLYFSLLVGNFEGYVSQVYTGTSVPHISGDQILAFPILIPESTIVEHFNKLSAGIVNKMSITENFTNNLFAIKNLLLSSMASKQLETVSC